MQVRQHNFVLPQEEPKDLEAQRAEEGPLQRSPRRVSTPVVDTCVDPSPSLLCTACVRGRVHLTTLLSLAGSGFRMLFLGFGRAALNHLCGMYLQYFAAVLHA